MSCIVLAKTDKGNASEIVRQATGPLTHDLDGRFEQLIDTPELAAAFVWRGQHASRGASTFSDSRFSVLVDGFVVVPRDARSSEKRGDGPSDAGQVLRCFLDHGDKGLEALQGSFVIVVVDRETKAVIVMTDRAGSRPIYVGSTAGTTLIASEPKAFSSHSDLAGEIAPGAVLSLTLNAYLAGELSFWKNVRLLGPARRLHLRDGRVDVTRYWVPEFVKSDAPDAREVGETVKQCLAGQLQPFRNPVLALSGGVDSRILLAAARELGCPTTSVTWSNDAKSRPEADSEVARRVAESCGMPNTQHALLDERFTDQASRIVYANDGLNGYLGGFIDREQLAQNLASEHDAIVFGDQCYRGEKGVSSTSAALESIGIRVGPRLSLVRFMMHRGAADACVADYETQVRNLVEDCSDCETAQDLQDRLYWQVRVPRLLTGPRSLWRLHLESLSPLLDFPMLRLACRLTPTQRIDKQALREGIASLAPSLADQNYSTVHSRTKWRRIFKKTGPIQQFIVETLLDPLPAFDQWFDRSSIEMMLRTHLEQARQLPRSTSSGGTMARVQRRMRCMWVNKAFNHRAILNLLTMKLWFHHFGTVGKKATPVELTASLAR